METNFFESTSNKIDGYVYIARIIDHGGKYVNGYHKIGLSKQYKVRETQLNSTHLPFDVQMVRVFESSNMKQLETLLHICFDDYRVVKEYDYRKNITTEWFDFSDIDDFNERVDKLRDLLGIVEVDLPKSVDNDTTLSALEKQEVKDKITKAKTSRFLLRIGDNTYEDGSQADLFVQAYAHIIKVVGKEQLLNYERKFKTMKENKEDFIGYRGIESVVDNPCIREVDGVFVYVYRSAKNKKRLIDNVCRNFGITDLTLEIED